MLTDEKFSYKVLVTIWYETISYQERWRDWPDEASATDF